MAHFFKSTQPKISLYTDLERRMRESSEYTIGPEPSSGDGQRADAAGQRIKIKINDEIVNADDLGRNQQIQSSHNNNTTIPGHLKKGLMLSMSASNHPRSENQSSMNITQTSGMACLKSKQKRLFEDIGKKNLAPGPGAYEVRDELIHKANIALPMSTTGRHNTQQ